jgi:hypothetical protein
MEDGIRKNAGECCLYWGHRKKPYHHQTGVFKRDRQAWGVVTGITTQNNSTIARILMTWT